jgi:hypothetical protein
LRHDNRGCAHPSSGWAGQSGLSPALQSGTFAAPAFSRRNARAVVTFRRLGGLQMTKNSFGIQALFMLIW